MKSLLVDLFRLCHSILVFDKINKTTVFCKYQTMDKTQSSFDFSFHEITPDEDLWRNMDLLCLSHDS